MGFSGADILFPTVPSRLPETDVDPENRLDFGGNPPGTGIAASQHADSR